MRILTSGILIALSCVAGCQQTHEISEITWFTTEISQRKQYTDERAPDLASIASGIDVRFSENPVSASGPYTHRSGYYYSREYSVSVTSQRPGARIDRWGVLELDDGRWKHAPFSRNDFAAAFDCPDGLLVAGRTYTLGQAHQVGVLPGKVRWYFVATDSRGERLKGEGLVESAAKDRQ